MQWTKIGDARPGQIIAQAVATPDGEIAYPPGFRLTAPGIERLRAAGVAAIAVKNPAVAGPDLRARLEELQDRFQGVDDPIMLQLKAVLEKRLRFLYLGNEPTRVPE
ncbi:MAG TPA: hypothetical protein PLO62_02235 [Candidatus Hydrogenedentes bacterium]|nr:hypothetical protein [Candidatus Hydrogenedentota bacterium]HOS02533.1 hypothetical protein [Candidatus Hydrogenedentota bacterium]